MMMSDDVPIKNQGTQYTPTTLLELTCTMPTVRFAKVM
jgi:hypothetical protein